MVLRTNSLTVRKSNWYLKSSTYGKVTVGLEGTATYHLLDDADATNTRNFSDAEAAAVAQGIVLPSQQRQWRWRVVRLAQDFVGATSSVV